MYTLLILTLVFMKETYLFVFEDLPNISNTSYNTPKITSNNENKFSTIPESKYIPISNSLAFPLSNPIFPAEQIHPSINNCYAIQSEGCIIENFNETNFIFILSLDLILLIIFLFIQIICILLLFLFK